MYINIRGIMKLINLTTALLCLVAFSSCTQQNKSSKTSPKKVKSELTLKREAFTKNYLISMKSEVDESIESYRMYEKYRVSTTNYKNLDIAEIKRLKHQFQEEYGDRAIVIQVKVDTSKQKMTEQQTQLVEMKKGIDEESKTFESSKKSTNQCISRLKKSHAELKSITTEKKNQFQSRKAQLNKDIALVKQYAGSLKKKGIAGAINKAIIELKIKEMNHAISIAEKGQVPPKISIHRDIHKLKKLLKVIKQINKVQRNSISLIKDSKSFKQTIDSRSKYIVTQNNVCTKKNDNLILVREKIKENVVKFNVLKAEFDNNSNDLVTYIKENEDFYTKYSEYKKQNDVLVGVVESKLKNLSTNYLVLETNLIQQYSKSYIEIYKRLAAWISSSEIRGRDTLDLIEYINRTEYSSQKLTEIKTQMVVILKTAEKKSITLIQSNSTSIDRKIAGTTLGDIGNSIGGIGRSLGNALGGITSTIGSIKLPEIKIEQIKLTEIKIDIPSVDLSDINIESGINSLNLPEIKIADLNLNEIVNLDLSDIKLTNIRVEIPQIDFISEFATELQEGITGFLESIASIEITVPEVELVRIEADVEEDLKNPGQIIANIKEATDEELTEAYQNLKRETDKAIRDTGKVVGDFVKQVRNWVAMLNGVDVDEVLEDIREQIKSCRVNNSKLTLINTDLKNLNTDIAKQDFENSNDNENKFEYVEKKLEGLENFKVNSGHIQNMSLTMLAYGFNTGTLATSSAMAGAAWVGGVAVIGVAMMENVSSEISHEVKKLKVCGDNYGKTFSQFDTLYSEFLTHMFEAKKVQSFIEINHKYSVFVTNYANRELGLYVEVELVTLRDELITLIEIYTENYPEEGKELDSILFSVEEGINL
jgi:hypothetical protein